jgi:general secretion pathway protein N
LTVALTALALCPASWMAVPLERITGGRLTLGDPEGTVWSGSAFIGGAPGSNERVTPILPDRFSWRLSPLVLLGRVDAKVENPGTLSDPVQITGSWSRWQLSAAAAVFPADRLSGLGAPLNTVRPAGRMRLSWGPLELAREGDEVMVNGTIALDIDDLSSRLSPIKPLGQYRLTMRCEGREVRMVLETIRGPMLLDGSGGFAGGRWRFTGRAQAGPGFEKDLANFLNLLGESHREGDKDVIALQFQ